MSSIRAVLIRSCMSTVQKEMEQLEQWLNRELMPTPAPSNLSNDTIYQAIQQLSKKLEVQQHTLNHIIDRMDVLEGTREIQINESVNDPWLDSSSTLLQNEIVDDDTLDEYDSIINVNKTEAIEQKAEPKVEVQVVEKVEPKVEVQVVEKVEPKVEVQVVEKVVQVEQEEEVEEEEVEEVEEVQEVQEEEEEEEEQEDMEYEEVDYKGSTYYRDNDKFIYQMNEEGELSEHPIGYWKEKSQSIVFYKNQGK